MKGITNCDGVLNLTGFNNCFFTSDLTIRLKNGDEYLLEPKEDITAYEMWGIFKFFKDIEVNMKSYPLVSNDLIFNRAIELKIDRHFKLIKKG